MAKKRRSRLAKIVLIGILFAFISIFTIYYMSNQQFKIGSSDLNLSEWLSGLAKVATPKLNNTDSNADVVYKFAVISDSHEDLVVYPQLVADIADRGDIKFVAHLGDQSNAGEIKKLEESKGILDTISAPVYVLPGDHDSNWVPRRDLTNFKQVFGLTQTSYAITQDKERFIFIDNSDGSQGIAPDAWSWLTHELESSKNSNQYIFMSTPLSNPYLTFKTMGSQSESVKNQAKELGKLLSNYNIRAIFAGDAHTFSQYEDEQTNIPIITVGAAGTNKNPLPMYVIVEILSDGGYNVSSIPLKK